MGRVAVAAGVLAALLLFVGLFQDTLVWIWVSIGSLLVAIVLGIMALVNSGRPSSEPQDSSRAHPEAPLSTPPDAAEVHDNESSSGAPADWYPAPGEEGTFRWWNGTSWTDHRRSDIAEGRQITRPVDGLSKWIIGLVLVSVALSGIQLLADGMRYILATQLETASDFEFQGVADQLDSAISTSGGAAVFDLLIFLVAGILFFVWLHRSWKNVQDLGAADLPYSAGWAVGSWFIPIVNLFRPYTTVRDVDRAARFVKEGRSGRSWAGDEPDSKVGWWWASFLVANLAARGATAFYDSVLQSDLDSAIAAEKTSALLDFVADAGFIAAGILLYLIVRQVTQAQEMSIPGHVQSTEVRASRSEPRVE